MATPLLNADFRDYQQAKSTSKPSWLHTEIKSLLQALSQGAYLHPIQTIVVISLLVSSTYISILNRTLLWTDYQENTGHTKWSSLMARSQNLHVGEATGWKWQPIEGESLTGSTQHLALLTFIFQNPLPRDPEHNAAIMHDMQLPQKLSILSLPAISTPTAARLQDSTLAFSIPFVDAPEFIRSVQEFPSSLGVCLTQDLGAGTINKPKLWIMKAAGASRSMTNVSNLYILNEVANIIKSTNAFDIAVTVIGYILMYLTFVSLFISMRRIGSSFWLATSVLLSSTFSFLFGLLVVTRLGISVDMVLLSQGLPFLVVIIGFENAISLTKAVLSASEDHRKAIFQISLSSVQKYSKGNNFESSIQRALRVAVERKGYQIVRNYAIEIVVLIAGARWGIQGRLPNFCLLAAWILCFDCILLFTFYTSILSVKLEVGRIERQIDLRNVSQDPRLGTSTAEAVGHRNDYRPETSLGVKSVKRLLSLIFKETTLPKFKVLMVSGFIIANVLTLCTAIPAIFGKLKSAVPTVSGSGVHGYSYAIKPPTANLYEFAAGGLDSILDVVKASGQSTTVTVFPQMWYEQECPSLYYASATNVAEYISGKYNINISGLYGIGERLFDKVLKSPEDPVLSKWIMGALVISLILNSQLYSATRCITKDFPVRQIPEPQNLGHSDNSAGSQGLERPQDQLEQILLEKTARELTDEELVELCLQGNIAGYALEKTLEDTTRAVIIRRAVVSRTTETANTTNRLEISKLPYELYNWDRVFGACCENVIGYMPLPVGVAGPIIIDGQSCFIPMATTEGVLVASASRGCKAINAGGGAVTVLTNDGMTRGPCVAFERLSRAGAAKAWLDSDIGLKMVKQAFDSTSQFARLKSVKTSLAGTVLYIRFKATTGDAMGMNMISKGVEHALKVMATKGGFDDMTVISLSANYCADKKAAAINWIDGRGKSVVAEAIIPSDVVRKVLKTNVDSLVELNVSKNLIGSAMAGSIGGSNAQAANILTAIFLATGQDPAQNVESSSCVTVMKNLRGNLHISVSMPSIEVGTTGGGTILEPQSAILDLLGIRGPHPTNPGENSGKLARIIAAGVLAGELSLCSALAAGHLVSAHMAHNRSAPATRSNTPRPMQ